MPMSHEQAIRAGKKTAEIRWGKHHRRSMQPVVGFYKDGTGKTRPITKPTTEIQRKKMVQKPGQFKSLNPRKPREAAQALEDLIGKLTEEENVLVDLNQKRREATQQLAITEIDTARTQQEQRISALKRKISTLST